VPLLNLHLTGLRVRRYARFVAWSLAAAIVILSLVPPTLRPETPAPHDLEHGIIYAAAGFAFGLGYELRLTTFGAVFLLFCGIVESMQLLVPGRHARLSDFVVDTVAMCAGAGVALLVGRAARR